MTVRVLTGDCRELLPTLEAESVQCVVTSPPYWGLRDYGVDGQIGLEATPTRFVAEIVAVFREVRRVLRGDGTLWLNLGDSFAGNRGSADNGGRQVNGKTISRRRDNAPVPRSDGRVAGLKPKDLIGVPWRVAFALQQDGWYLRTEIIWHKLNPMPEAVKDRPTRSHEYIFLLTKSARYYYNADAITEPVSPSTHARVSQNVIAQLGSQRANGGSRADRPMKAVVTAPKTVSSAPGSKQNSSFADATVLPVTRRNKRSVWSVATEAYSGAHFATFPPALIEPCILAGSRPGDCILDPFGGAGTTGLVADRLRRDALLIELNPAYAQLARDRITSDAPLFSDAAEGA